jgi:toxin YoeB
LRVAFDEKAFAEYTEWQFTDKRVLKRINELIRSITRDGFMRGIGKPEVLKSRKAYSRRIDEANRLVYIGDSEQNIIILSCKGHYDDWKSISSLSSCVKDFNSL